MSRRNPTQVPVLRSLLTRRITLPAIIGFVVLAAVACSGGEGGDFGINTYQSGGVLEGRSTNLDAVLAQGKPVVLNFWAGLCPPCRAEMPALEDAWQEFGEEVSIVGIDIGPFTGLGSFQDGQALIRELGITYPAGSTDERGVPSLWGVTSMPSTFFLNADGTTDSKWIGAITPARLRQRIRALTNG